MELRSNERECVTVVTGGIAANDYFLGNDSSNMFQLLFLKIGEMECLIIAEALVKQFIVT